MILISLTITTLTVIKLIKHNNKIIKLKIYKIEFQKYFTKQIKSMLF